MAILLKNLIAREPQKEDFATVSAMIVACECAENSAVDSLLELLSFCWKRADFSLARDAWVIATMRGEIAGFACVGHTDHTCISVFIWVHPLYRKRGVGTLLLRLVEMRARQHIRLAPPASRVVLQSQMNAENEGARYLFEREEYQLKHQFLRLFFTPDGSSRPLPVPAEVQNLRGDVTLDPSGLRAPWLSEHDVFCNACLYQLYEKELRSASEPSTTSAPGAEPEKLAMLVSSY